MIDQLIQSVASHLGVDESTVLEMVASGQIKTGQFMGDYWASIPPEMLAT